VWQLRQGVTILIFMLHSGFSPESCGYDYSRGIAPSCFYGARLDRATRIFGQTLTRVQTCSIVSQMDFCCPCSRTIVAFRLCSV